MPGIDSGYCIIYKRNVLNLHGYTGTACNRIILQVFCKVKTDFQEAGLYISYNKITLAGFHTGFNVGGGGGNSDP